MIRGTLFALSALLCGTGFISAQEATHFSEKEAGKLFPKELAGYKLKNLKLKKKSDSWVEYSATYKTSKKGEKELKLVINDVFPAGKLEWQDEFAEITELISGHKVKEVKDDDKYTVMVLVGDRFRVDFKSRKISPEKLQEMAKAFDFSPVASIRTLP